MSYRHIRRWGLPKTKVAVTLDTALLCEVNDLVARRRFRNRSQAIETALAEKIARLNGTRLAQECRRLDPRVEKAMAEEGVNGSIDTWPEYSEAKSDGRTCTPCAAGNRRANAAC